MLFLIYTNGLPLSIKHISIVILFADDKSLLVTYKNYEQFKQKAGSAMLCLGQWFDTNQLVLKFTKTNLVKCTPIDLVHISLTIEYKNILIDKIANTKFLDMHVDNHMNWKKHIELIVPKLSAACYAIRRLYYTLKSDALHMVYFAFFHSMINYRLIFWGNSTSIHRVFRLQKKIIRNRKLL